MTNLLGYSQKHKWRICWDNHRSTNPMFASNIHSSTTEEFASIMHRITNAMFAGNIHRNRNGVCKKRITEAQRTACLRERAHTHTHTHTHTQAQVMCFALGSLRSTNTKETLETAEKHKRCVRWEQSQKCNRQVCLEYSQKHRNTSDVFCFERSQKHKDNICPE